MTLNRDLKPTAGPVARLAYKAVEVFETNTAACVTFILLSFFSFFAGPAFMLSGLPLVGLVAFIPFLLFVMATMLYYTQAADLPYCGYYRNAWQSYNKIKDKTDRQVAKSLLPHLYAHGLEGRASTCCAQRGAVIDELIPHHTDSPVDNAELEVALEYIKARKELG